MSDPENLLEGFEREAEWSKRHGVTQRTTQRYRTLHGLPAITFANRVYIDTKGAREWFEKRVKRADTTRQGRR